MVQLIRHTLLNFTFCLVVYFNDNCDFGNCYSDFKFDCVHSDFDWLVERQECRPDEIIEFIEI